MSNFDDLIESLKPSEKAVDILAGVELILTADDLKPNDRAGFATGFLVGLTYALAKSNEGDTPGAALTLLRLQREWEARGVT
jgi:hypothetical protein